MWTLAAEHLIARLDGVVAGSPGRPGPSTLPDGTRLRAFNREERLDLLEYLKSL